jgi:hypothetical protein
VLEDEAGGRGIGTRAAVVEVLQVFDDRRMSGVIVEGHERFRLRELTSGRIFLTSRRRARGRERRKQDAGITEESAVAVPAPGRRGRRRRRRTEDDAGPLSFRSQPGSSFGTEPKQELIRIRSEPEQLRHLCPLLEAAIRSPSRQRARIGNARNERQGLPR